MRGPHKPHNGHGAQCAETSDHYPHVVARLNGEWRVIRCSNDIQWILQRRVTAERWRNVNFCRTRGGLVMCVRAHVHQISGDALVRLLWLPERFPDAPHSHTEACHRRFQSVGGAS